MLFRSVEASKKSAVTKGNSKASRTSEKERMEIELSDVHESSITGKPKRDKKKRTEMLENEKKKKDSQSQFAGKVEGTIKVGFRLTFFQ